MHLFPKGEMDFSKYGIKPSHTYHNEYVHTHTHIYLNISISNWKPLDVLAMWPWNTLFVYIIS